MEGAELIIAIASPIIACIVYILKKDSENSTKITFTLLDAYIKNLEDNSKMVSRLAETLENSAKQQKIIKESQDRIECNQESMIRKQEQVSDYIYNNLKSK